MKFGGPAPEVINSRAAMLAVPIAACLESSSGKTTLDSMVHAPLQFVGLVGLISVASLIPILKGAKYEALGTRCLGCPVAGLRNCSTETWGFAGVMSPQTELYNGRAAMLGFMVLLAIEARFGVCFF